jgi:hypothetical protein
MARRQNRPLGRRIQARMMRVINVPMRVVLGLRFADAEISSKSVDEPLA